MNTPIYNEFLPVCDVACLAWRLLLHLQFLSMDYQRLELNCTGFESCKATSEASCNFIQIVHKFQMSFSSSCPDALPRNVGSDRRFKVLMTDCKKNIIILHVTPWILVQVETHLREMGGLYLHQKIRVLVFLFILLSWPAFQFRRWRPYSPL
jgi:hypothetical protein